MKKILILSMFLTILSGCGQERIRTVYQEKDVPVYVVPAPPKVQQPDLAINNLTEKQKDDIGELAKAYNISLVQLGQYACKLKNIVDKYEFLSTTSPTPVSPLLSSLTLTNNNILNVNLEQGCNEKN